MTIAIDIDGVLRDNLGVMVDLYNAHFNDNLKIEDITDFRTDVIFPRIEGETGTTASHWFFQDHSKEIFEDAQPYPFVSEDIKKLQTFAEVIIVSYQKTYKNRRQALDWLEKHGIDANGVCFLKDKTKINCDFLLDDNDWNFIGSNAVRGILIDAPYNKTVNVDILKSKSNCEKIMRCGSLHEFVENYGNYCL